MRVPASLASLLLPWAPAVAQGVAAAPAVAFHEAYGAGCYDVASESFYVLEADAALAAAALPGQSLVLTRGGSGYAAAWGGAVFRPPTAAATSLPRSDDGQVAIAPTLPLPIPGGAAATLWVHSNGIVSTGAGNDGGAWNTPPNDFTPSAAFCRAPDTAFWAWHDWNPAEAGSGPIATEEALVGGERVLFVTWNDVENFPAGVPNRGTFQFQFGLATGRVAYVWVQVDPSTASPFSTAHLIGYSPGGSSLDPGPTAVPSGLPLSTAPDQHALALQASPPPVSTPLAGTAVTYTTHHLPTTTPYSSLRTGFTALSIAAAPAVDLGFAGAPGCQAHVQSLDIQLLLFGTSPSLSAPVAFPPGMPAGLDVYAQSLALVPPATKNVLGIVTSNGIHSRVQPQ